MTQECDVHEDSIERFLLSCTELIGRAADKVSIGGTVKAESSD